MRVAPGEAARPQCYFNQAMHMLDACDVLVRLGYRVELLGGGGGRPVCCGRTFLSAGLVDQAKTEAESSRRLA